MNAYVTLVMLGDRYVNGALALGQSLIESGTIHPLVCMLAGNVSTDAREKLKAFYKIIDVPLITFKCGKMLTLRENELYGTWINHAFTKWNCLNFYQYKKIIYIDADQIVVKNIDHLFELETPAVCFDHLYSEKYIDGSFKNPYSSYKYKEKIDCKYLQECFDSSTMVCATGTVVLTPDKCLFDTICSLLNKHNDELKRARFHNGFEEIVFAQALIKTSTSPTQLDVKYLCNVSHSLSTESFVYNYFGSCKPWEFKKPYKHNDIFTWWYFFNLISTTTKQRKRSRNE